MTTVTTVLISALLAFIATVSNVYEVVASDRQIQVRTSLRTSGGEPIAGITFQSQTSRGVFRATTDSRGVAAMFLATHDDEQSITLVLDSDDATKQQRTADMLKSFYYPYAHPDRPLSLRLEPDKELYDVEVVVQPTVTLRATLKRADDGQLVRRALCSLRYRSKSVPKLPGEAGLVFRDTPAARTNELYVVTPPLVTVIPISRDTLKRDADLGVIEIQAVTKGVPLGDLTIRTLRSEDLQALWRDHVGGCTFLSMDGTIVYSFSPHDHTIVITAPAYYAHKADVVTSVIPDGRYYVVPESFSASGPQTRMLDLIRDGHDLSDAGLVTVEIKPDQQNDIEIDLVETYQRIRALLEKVDQQTQKPDLDRASGSNQQPRTDN